MSKRIKIEKPICGSTKKKYNTHFAPTLRGEDDLTQSEYIAVPSAWEPVAWELVTMTH